MTKAEIYNLYILQSENVRALWKVKNGLVKDLNRYIRKKDDFQVQSNTKLLSLLYSAWSEAQFTQVIYTPNGFLYSEISKIIKQRKYHGISKGWQFMVERAMNKVGNTEQNTDLRNRLTTLLDLIKDFIDEPSILRNKIAHGQWINALNAENTKKNQDITNKLRSLDPVEIEKRFVVHRYLGYIIRDLIQSPKVGFHRHYWTNIVNLEKYIKKTKKWSLESKKRKLILKPICYEIKED